MIKEAELTTIRQRCKELSRLSDAAHARAGALNREHTDYEAYKQAVAEAHRYGEEYGKLLCLLPADEREAIKVQALVRMAEGFVRGLGGAGATVENGSEGQESPNRAITARG